MLMSDYSGNNFQGLRNDNVLENASILRDEIGDADQMPYGERLNSNITEATSAHAALLREITIPNSMSRLRQIGGIERADQIQTQLTETNVNRMRLLQEIRQRMGRIRRRADSNQSNSLSPRSMPALYNMRPLRNKDVLLRLQLINTVCPILSEPQALAGVLSDDTITENLCPICLEVVEGQLLRYTGCCGNLLHSGCLEMSILKGRNDQDPETALRHLKCPFCRQCFNTINFAMWNGRSEGSING